MAEVERKRTLINPHRKKKRRRNAKRKLSPKQIAIFGSKRQKAALKASRKRKRKNAGHFSWRKTKKRLKKTQRRGGRSFLSPNGRKAVVTRKRRTKKRRP